MPILIPLRTNDFNAKDSFHFAEEIIDQQPDFFMESLYADSLVTNIPSEETIEICTNDFFRESETVEGLSKSEFQKLLSLATKDSHFIFDGTLYKKIDGVAMGCPLGPTLGHTEIPGLWTRVLDAGLWTLVSGWLTLDGGLWTLEARLSMLGAGS